MGHSDAILIVGVVASCGLIFGLIGTVAAIAAWAELRAVQKSTHQVQFVPADTTWQREEEALNRVMERDIPEMAGVESVNEYMQPIS